MGLGLVPAFATLYQRLMMPEGKKFLESKELNSSRSSTKTGKAVSSTVPPPSNLSPVIAGNVPETAAMPPKISLAYAAQDTSEKAKLDTFFVYFSEWRHLKTLLGTALTWFLLDIAFYGTNLNQTVLLSEIGFSTGKNEYDVLMRNAVGNLIMAISGYIPGYFVTIFLVEILGRRWIQIQGFLVCALMFAVLAGDYGHMGTAGKFVCFAIAQVCHSHIYQILAC
jgi:PHS family inorganic phosphate transporter-like MFS transporter